MAKAAPSVFDVYKDTPMYKIVNIKNVRASLVSPKPGNGMSVLLWREKVKTPKGVKWRIWIDWNHNDFSWIE